MEVSMLGVDNVGASNKCRITKNSKGECNPNHGMKMNPNQQNNG